MANLRILYKNIFDDSTTVTASTTAGSLSTANLKTEIKSHVHRSISTSVTYTVNWSNSQRVNCVILPCTNLSQTSTIRVRLYDAASTMIYDSTAILAASGISIDLGTRTYNANIFAYGFNSKTAVWIPSLFTDVRSCTIDLVDTNSNAGYIDCSRILIGEYWESTYNVENGIQLQSIDSSIVSRTNAGELVSDIGFIYDKVAFNFALLSEEDRAKITKIIKFVGTNKNLFFSVFPDYYTDTVEQDFMIYGKRSNSPLSYKVFGYYNHSVEITSW